MYSHFFVVVVVVMTATRRLFFSAKKKRLLRAFAFLPLWSKVKGKQTNVNARNPEIAVASFFVRSLLP